MKTFKEFLREQFFKGAKGSYGYIEIFKNPSSSEIRDLRKTTSELGAWIVDSSVYVWDRSNAGHSGVKHEIPAGKEKLPLYLYPSTDGKKLRVSVSSFSATDDYAYMSNQQIVDIVAAHPAFKYFEVVPY